MPAPAIAQTVAITGGKVYPVSGPPIENATVVIVDGKITAVGANVTVPAGAATVDAKGKWVTPGLIIGASALGLVETDADPGTNDTRAKGDHNVAAAFRAWEGLNPESVLFSPARNAGLTTAIALPGGGLISGQAAAIDLVNGATGKAITRKAPVAMVANLGSAQAADTTRARRAVHALPRSAGRCEGLRDEEAGLRARGDARVTRWASCSSKRCSPWSAARCCC